LNLQRPFPIQPCSCVSLESCSSLAAALCPLRPSHWVCASSCSGVPTAEEKHAQEAETPLARLAPAAHHTLHNGRRRQCASACPNWACRESVASLVACTDGSRPSALTLALGALDSLPMSSHPPPCMRALSACTSPHVAADQACLTASEQAVHSVPPIVCPLRRVLLGGVQARFLSANASAHFPPARLQASFPTATQFATIWQRLRR
jgi:hypothetical protein